MPLMTPRATAAQPFDQLALLTCLGALDGTIVLLAATGRMTGWVAAITVGLTVVSGAGAWIAARQAFAGRPRGRDYVLLGGMAALSITATVAAAWLGTALGTAVTLHVLPKAAGIVLLLVAADVGGLRLPRLGRVPLPLIAVAAGAALEGGVQWIH